MDPYVRMRGIRCPTDFAVGTESDLEKHGSDPFLVYHDAITQGGEVYRAPAAA